MPQSREELDFWQSRWSNRDTPWDLRGPHPLTHRVIELLATHCCHIFHPGNKAYLPACGSAHDSMPLQKSGFSIVAEDLVADAVASAVQLYGSETIHCRVGNSLETSAAEEASFDLIFDRAALCAMQPHLRQTFWDSCMKKLKPGGVFASILFTRMKPEFEGVQGPPFIITTETIQGLFSDNVGLLAAEEYPCANQTGKILFETIVLVMKDQEEK
jgi:hypothetical protein